MKASAFQQLSTPKETCPLTYENGFLPELPKKPNLII